MTAINPFRGVIVPTVTPLRDDQSIDVDAVSRIADHLLANGAHALFPLGTTGEAMSLRFKHRLEIVSATVRSVAGRAPVLAGISSNAMDESVELAHAFAELGVDATVAHVPSYYPLDDAQCERYFALLADRCPLPLVLYNIPATTHHDLSMDVVVRLSAHPNIRAIKDSAKDANRLVRLIGAVGDFPVLAGTRSCFSHGLRAGAVGIVPAGAHLMPNKYRAQFDAAMASSWEEVARLQRVTDEGIGAALAGLSVGQSIAAIKSHLASRGLCSNVVLPPLAPIEWSNA